MKGMGARLSGVVLVFCVLSGASCLDSSFTELTDTVTDELQDSFDNFADSAKEAVQGFLTPDGLFNSAIQLVAGYPFVVVLTAIRAYCSAALATNTVKPLVTPDITKIQFQLRSECETAYFPLLESENILLSPNFDPNKKVVVLVSGWTVNANNTGMMKDIVQAYLCRGDTNVIAVDSANFIDTLYSWSAFNTDLIGQHIAVGLSLIADVVPVENIHLIGHSLGAHIVGSAGRYFSSMTNRTLPRITGLDPANPCFNKGQKLIGLSRNDADFVDAIHTNPDALGKRDPVGDADFYVGGLDPLQAGCLDISCSHSRAFEYYAESVYPGNEQNFIGTRCTDLENVWDDSCTGEQDPMGYACPPTANGNYLLDVNYKSPYGENGDPQRSAALKNCGLCDQNKK